MSNSYIEDILEGEVFAGKSAMLSEVLVGPEVLQRLEQCEQLHKDRLVGAGHVEGSDVNHWNCWSCDSNPMKLE